MKKILIYGAGENCNVFFANALLEDISIIGIADQNKIGEQVSGIEIKPLKEFDISQCDEILVTPKYNDDIVNKLIESCGVAEERIIRPGEINRKYILPRIQERDNVFITRGKYESCFSFVFRKMEREGRMLILRILDSVEYMEEEKSFLSKKLFLFLSDDVKALKENGTLGSLKHMYPNAKKLLWLCNPCDNLAYGIPELFDLYQSSEHLKEEFDFCYTYHRGDAEKYGLCYYPQFYPDIAVDYQSEANPEYDVFFVGNAKKRFGLIYDVFRRLTDAGLRCKFYIFNLKEENRIYEEGLVYIDNWISYEDTLYELGKCRCILEICDEGDETSYRFAEAVIFGKKLLVNDDTVKRRSYYSETNIFTFHNAEEIDTEWVKGPVEDYGYKGDYDPAYYLDQIIGALQ